MILLDVNVLVYAFQEDVSDHPLYADWLRGSLDGDEPMGLSELVLSGFVRIVTHPAIFSPPVPLKAALEFADVLRDEPNVILVSPGERHWEIFRRLCLTAGAKGNLVADAFLAALAIEIGGEWITTDRDFSRFPGLRWRHPLGPTVGG